MKVCGKCKEEKNESEFYIHRKKGKKPYLSSICKNCHCDKTKEWGEKHKEKVKKIKLKWVINNPKKRKESANKWARENYNIENVKRWQRNNPEKVNLRIKNISDSYIKELLVRKQGFTKEAIEQTPDIIESKKLIIKIRRYVKEKTNN